MRDVAAAPANAPVSALVSDPGNAPVTKAKPRVFVVMGVSGSGKTSIARGIAAALDLPFQEGDALHPAANVAKMTAGTPLTDEDRAPWLDRCRAWIMASAAAGTGGVLTCSALRRAYRERLLAPEVDVRFIYLKVPREMLEARLARRKGHFMPASLLPSQLQTLEEPAADEPALTVQTGASPQETTAMAVTAIRAL